MNYLQILRAQDFFALGAVALQSCFACGRGWDFALSKNSLWVDPDGMLTDGTG